MDNRKGKRPQSQSDPADADSSAPPAVRPLIFRPSQLSGVSWSTTLPPSGPNLSLRSDNSPFSKLPSPFVRPQSQFSHHSPAPRLLRPPQPAPSQIQAEAEAGELPPSSEYSVEMMRKWCKDGKNTSFPTMEELYEDRQNIPLISGVVRCTKCNLTYAWGYRIADRLPKIDEMMSEVKAEMEETKEAPEFWCEPDMHKCRDCGEMDAVMPVLATKKKELNYLHLFLSHHLSFCSLAQLNYFIKHNSPPNSPNPSPYTKEHLLYLCYTKIYRQLTADNDDDNDDEDDDE